MDLGLELVRLLAQDVGEVLDLVLGDEDGREYDGLVGEGVVEAELRAPAPRPDPLQAGVAGNEIYF